MRGSFGGKRHVAQGVGRHQVVALVRREAPGKVHVVGTVTDVRGNMWSILTHVPGAACGDIRPGGVDLFCVGKMYTTLVSVELRSGLIHA